MARGELLVCVRIPLEGSLSFKQAQDQAWGQTLFGIELWEGSWGAQ